MRLPEAIERAIDLEAAALPARALARAAEALSSRYRESPQDPRVHDPRVHEPGAHEPRTRELRVREPRVPDLTDTERLAYVIVRAPATYAAVASVLGEMRQRAPGFHATSVLDLGAGPGAATWAALTRDVVATQQDAIARVTLIERDRGFIELGRRIMNAARADVAPHAELDWQCADLRALPNLPSHDLVIVSYALGELDTNAARDVLQRAWTAARHALVLVEPGTPRHFARLLEARERLIRDGGFIAAPCPHELACPMAGVDWCHMPARVERTSLHRRLKSAALPYEDEKFSYVIVMRDRAVRAAARIVRRPEIQKGFVALTLCTPEGLRREGVPRSKREAFRVARKADWGDAWELEREEMATETAPAANAPAASTAMPANANDAKGEP
jgi:ribosomal protein RSM22 (predicted rRNA methylase)